MAYIPATSMTAAAALKQHPFLKELFTQTGVKGAKKIHIRQAGDIVTIKNPICDYYVRYISFGRNDGEIVSTIYGGTSDVPQDVLAHNVEGQRKLKQNTFFAILDKGNNEVRIDLFTATPKQITA